MGKGKLALANAVRRQALATPVAYRLEIEAQLQQVQTALESMASSGMLPPPPSAPLSEDEALAIVAEPRGVDDFRRLLKWVDDEERAAAKAAGTSLAETAPGVLSSAVVLLHFDAGPAVTLALMAAGALRMALQRSGGLKDAVAPDIAYLSWLVDAVAPETFEWAKPPGTAANEAAARRALAALHDAPVFWRAVAFHADARGGPEASFLMLRFLAFWLSFMRLRYPPAGGMLRLAPDLLRQLQQWAQGSAGGEAAMLARRVLDDFARAPPCERDGWRFTNVELPSEDGSASAAAPAAAEPTVQSFHVPDESRRERERAAREQEEWEVATPYDSCDRAVEKGFLDGKRVRAPVAPAPSHDPNSNTGGMQSVIWKEQGNAAFKRGQFERAVEYYTRAIDIEDDVPSYYTNRAMALMRAGAAETGDAAVGLYESAVRDCDRALRQDKLMVKALFRKAELLELLGRRDEALVWATAARKRSGAKEIDALYRRLKQ